MHSSSYRSRTDTLSVDANVYKDVTTNAVSKHHSSLWYTDLTSQFHYSTTTTAMHHGIISVTELWRTARARRKMPRAVLCTAAWGVTDASNDCWDRSIIREAEKIKCDLKVSKVNSLLKSLWNSMTTPYASSPPQPWQSIVQAVSTILLFITHFANSAT